MRIVKWDVPVDGERHSIGGGRVVMVEWQMPAVEVLLAYDAVHVWTEEGEPIDPPRTVVVIPDDTEYDTVYCRHLGSTQTFHGQQGRSWHVLEVFDIGERPCGAYEIREPHEEHVWDTLEHEKFWCPGVGASR